MARYDFLKLTRSKDGSPAYIEAGHISTMLIVDKATYVYLTGDPTPVSVVETPEQILALMGFRTD